MKIFMICGVFIYSHKMSKNIHNIESTTDNAPKLGKRVWNARIIFQTTKKITDTIQSQPQKNEINAHLFNEWIENIVDRAYPLDSDTTDKKEISEMDCYYIPDIKDPTIQELLQNDDKIYEILNWLLCRPQFFWKNRKTWERQITKEWLKRLNYILNMAAKHTLRHIEEASLLHTVPASNEKKPWSRDPTSNSNLHKTNETKLRPWYNYFQHKLKDFTTSQRSDKDRKNKIYFNIKTKEEFCQLVRALIVDYIPTTSGWSQIYPSTYEQDYWKYRLEYDENIGKNRAIPIKVTHPKWEIRLKPISTRIKDWLFLKNISSFGDMERSDAYTWKRTHFPQIIREMHEPLLQIYKPQNSSNDNSKKIKSPEREKKELENHEIEYSKNFNIDYKRDKIGWRFILWTKSQNAMLDKTRRNANYSTLKDLKDMIRWSFIMKNHHDVIFMLHYYIKYFIQNPEHNFDHDSSNNAWFDPQNWALRWLQFHDKWILNTEIEEWVNNLKSLPKWKKPKGWKNPSDFTDDELNRAATNFILSSIPKSSDKKSSNSTKYIDTKLNVPIIMRPNPFPIEIKFLTRENYENNERWLAHHDIMRLKQNIKQRCRDIKFVLAEKIKREIELLLRKNPGLKSQIESDLIANNRGKDNLDAAEEIYKDIKSNLVILKYWEWENWLEPTVFCDKEIWTSLKNAEFTYSPNDIRNDTL